MSDTYEQRVTQLPNWETQTHGSSWAFVLSGVHFFNELSKFDQNFRNEQVILMTSESWVHFQNLLHSTWPKISWHNIYWDPRLAGIGEILENLKWMIIWMNLMLYVWMRCIELSLCGFQLTIVYKVVVIKTEKLNLYMKTSF